MNSELLLQKIKDKGMSIGDICKRLDMSRSAFYRKVKGITEFTQSEIAKICAILDLDSPMDVFFSSKVS